MAPAAPKFQHTLTRLVAGQPFAATIGFWPRVTVPVAPAVHWCGPDTTLVVGATDVVGPAAWPPPPVGAQAAKGSL